MFLPHPGVLAVPGPAAGQLVEPGLEPRDGLALPPGRGVEGGAEGAGAGDALVTDHSVVSPPVEIRLELLRTEWSTLIGPARPVLCSDWCRL